MRVRLLDAARQLFSEKGVAGTTIDDITECADVGRATFFNYFQSKDAVLQALWMEQLDNVRATVAEEIAQPRSTADRLLSVFRAFESAAMERPDYLRAVTGELERDWNAEANARYRLEAFHAALLPLVVEGIAQGDVRTDFDVDLLTEMIAALYLSVVRHWRLYPEDDLSARVLDTTHLLSEVVLPKGCPTNTSARKR